MSAIRKLWYLAQLRRNVWKKKEDLMRLQEKKLRAIIQYSYENIKFYHEEFNSIGLKPSDIRSVEDLKKLPLIDRHDVRSNYPNLIVNPALNTKKCKIYRTSGSSGIPVNIALDEDAEDYRAALFGRPFLECGLRLTDRMLEIVDERNINRKKCFYQYVGLLRRVYVPASQSVEQQLPFIAKCNPDAIYGYSSWLYLLARALRHRQNLKIYPKLVFSTAEVLTRSQRDIIESVFGTDVLDFYGCVEVERMAWECSEHTGYHMDVDSNVIEFIRDGEEVAPGERGQVVVTCLYNYGMPLIRYSLDDIAVPINEQCPCGRGLPLMKQIEGRNDDMIETQKGKIIVPEAFSQLFRTFPWIRRYKVLQKKGGLTVYLEKEMDFDNTDLETMKESINVLLEEDTNIEISIVSKIPKEKSGKFRAVVACC